MTTSSRTTARPARLTTDQVLGRLSIQTLTPPVVRERGHGVAGSLAVEDRYAVSVGDASIKVTGWRTCGWDAEGEWYCRNEEWQYGRQNGEIVVTHADADDDERRGLLVFRCGDASAQIDVAEALPGCDLSGVDFNEVSHRVEELLNDREPVDEPSDEEIEEHLAEIEIAIDGEVLAGDAYDGDFRVVAGVWGGQRFVNFRGNRLVSPPTRPLPRGVNPTLDTLATLEVGNLPDGLVRRLYETFGLFATVIINAIGRRFARAHI